MRWKIRIDIYIMYIEIIFHAIEPFRISVVRFDTYIDINTYKNIIMFRNSLTFVLTCLIYSSFLSQTPSLVDYDSYEKIVLEVKEHRAERLISTDEFVEMSKMDDVVILDTRSKAMYTAKHIKGAIHLNFSDFTQDNLEDLLPSRDVNILIYCNNNFADDPKFFASKIYVGPEPLKSTDVSSPMSAVTMALNIPTYINLYGYGYKNVYELSELISVFDKRIKLEGTALAPRR